MARYNPDLNAWLSGFIIAAALVLFWIVASLVVFALNASPAEGAPLPIPDMISTEDSHG